MEHLTLWEDSFSSTGSPPRQRRSSLEPTKSPFLKLPAEIRNVIYTDLFQDQEQRIRPDYTLPGLLASCKLIHTEAIGLYYSLTTFRCLDEDSTVSWLTNLPTPHLDLIPEVRYDTRWIVFIKPMIPVPGMECWLYRGLIKRLGERGFDVNQLGQRVREDGEVEGEGKLKISYYGRGNGGRRIMWTDKPGLIEGVRAVGRV